MHKETRPGADHTCHPSTWTHVLYIYGLHLFCVPVSSFITVPSQSLAAAGGGHAQPAAVVRTTARQNKDKEEEGTCTRTANLLLTGY